VDEYSLASPDELMGCASRLVHSYNSERVEDVLRIASSCMGVPFEQVWKGLRLKGLGIGTSAREWGSRVK